MKLTRKQSRSETVLHLQEPLKTQWTFKSEVKIKVCLRPRLLHFVRALRILFSKCISHPPIKNFT